MGLNQHDNYQAPKNLHLGTYLFFGFIPRVRAAERGNQGVNINGENLEFNNCDANGSSQIVLYPNFNEEPIRDNHHKSKFAEDFFLKSARNPSGRLMPLSYFMLT